MWLETEGISGDVEVDAVRFSVRDASRLRSSGSMRFRSKSSSR